jgi:chromatin segregation and condensation protein Rec8/ScpA/Scc1 (kleisin family)
MPEEPDAELSDEFYRALDRAIEEEQLKAAVEHLKESMNGGQDVLEKKAA